MIAPLAGFARTLNGEAATWRLADLLAGAPGGGFLDLPTRVEFGFQPRAYEPLDAATEYIAGVAAVVSSGAYARVECAGAQLAVVGPARITMRVDGRPGTQWVAGGTRPAVIAPPPTAPQWELTSSQVAGAQFYSSSVGDGTIPPFGFRGGGVVTLIGVSRAGLVDPYVIVPGLLESLVGQQRTFIVIPRPAYSAWPELVPNVPSDARVLYQWKLIAWPLLGALSVERLAASLSWAGAEPIARAGNPVRRGGRPFAWRTVYAAGAGTSRAVAVDASGAVHTATTFGAEDWLAADFFPEGGAAAVAARDLRGAEFRVEATGLVDVVPFVQEGIGETVTPPPDDDGGGDDGGDDGGGGGSLPSSGRGFVYMQNGVATLVRAEDLEGVEWVP